MTVFVFLILFYSVPPFGGKITEQFRLENASYLTHMFFYENFSEKISLIFSC